MNERKKKTNQYMGKGMIKNLIGVSVLSLAVLTGVTGCRRNERLPDSEASKVTSAVSMMLTSVKTASMKTSSTSINMTNKKTTSTSMDMTNIKLTSVKMTGMMATGSKSTVEAQTTDEIQVSPELQSVDRTLLSTYIPKQEIAEQSETDQRNTKLKKGKRSKKADKNKADRINHEQSELLVLVNKDHPLSEDYDVKMKTLDNSDKVVAEMIIQDLQDMLADGTREGMEFCIASAYRSSERQQEILDQDIKKLTDKGMTEAEAYDQATRTVMPAGYSEHETGLALDIVALSNQLLDDSQENTPETQWLHENCDKYGFILRYPKEKTEITGIDYESWHYRYVGKEAAAYIKKHDLTFEEYLEEKI